MVWHIDGKKILTDPGITHPGLTLFRIITFFQYSLPYTFKRILANFIS